MNKVFKILPSELEMPSGYWELLQFEKEWIKNQEKKNIDRPLFSKDHLKERHPDEMAWISRLSIEESKT